MPNSFAAFEILPLCFSITRRIVFFSTALKFVCVSSEGSGADSMGEKIFELDLDEKGKTITKSMYVYDKNGLRKEKKIYNAKEELIGVKKYTYKTSGDD